MPSKNISSHKPEFVKLFMSLFLFVMPFAKKINITLVAFLFAFLAFSLLDDNPKIKIVKQAQAQAVTHPFLIVKEAEYTELRGRANQAPWSSMKSAAISKAALSYIAPTGAYDATKVYTYFERMRDIVSGAALAYILDPGNKTTYKNKIRDTLNNWDSFWAWFRNGPIDTNTTVLPGSVFFNSVVALDIIYNDLTSSERTAIETKLNNVANWYWNNRFSSDNAFGCLSTWAIYKNDATWAPRIAGCVSSHLGAIVPLTSDGVYQDGFGYGQTRMCGYGSGRDGKSMPMSVIDYTGNGTPFSNSKIRNMYEFMFGYTLTPFKEIYSFGDSAIEANNIGNGAALFRAYKFLISAPNSKVAKYAAWANNDATPQGYLMHYILYKPTSFSAGKETPVSKIFENGAWLYEDNMVSASLAGVLWNCKVQSYHTHKETNSLHLCAYGDHVLRNVGYAYSAPSPWTSWALKAEAGNTVLIAGVDHQSKIGTGIVEGLISNKFDYARGDSGNALSNGKHYRNFVFVKPQDGKNGYWLLYDEVTVNTAGNPINVILHPHSAVYTTVTTNKEYRFDIKDNTYLKLTIFLATAPNSATVKDGFFKDNWNAGWTGKYLYSTYNTSGTNKKIVTVLFPHDNMHAKATLSSISGSGYTGANIDLGGSIIDTALESSGGSVLTYNSVSFQGTAVWYRKNSGINAGYFVRQGKTFRDGYYGFESSSAVTLHLKDKSGKITSPGTSVTFYYPGISSAYIDGILATPTSSNTNVSITVYVATGTHSISFNSGSTAVATPAFSPAAGTYTSAQNVSISTATSGVTIYYTLDGSDPASSATRAVYSSAIAVSSTKTIKAKAFKTGMTPSVTSSATYTISSSGGSVNLVSNPSFETGSASPWLFYNNGTGTSAIVSPGYSGTYAAKMSITTAGTNVQLYQNNITIDPNTRYRLTFSAYSNTGHDLIVKSMKNASPYTNYGLSYVANLTTSWQTFTTEFTSSGLTATDADSLLQFYLASYIAAGDVYYIDNVILEKVTTTTPPPPATPVNLLDNPSFETGSASPWLFYNNGTGSSAIVSPGYSGTYAAKMSITTAGTNVQVYQSNISIEPNTRYRLTFSAYSNTGHDLVVKLMKNSSPYTNYGLSYIANLTTSWQTFTTEFTSSGLTATDADSLLQFYLASYIAAGDVYYIDNVKLEKI